jgi:hypothetical protein
LFKPNTVFVIGAAASFIDPTGTAQCGFPLGTALKTAVARELSVAWSQDRGWVPTDQTDPLYDAIHTFLSQSKHSDRRGLYVAGSQVMNGVAFSSSIDNFLHVRRKDHNIVACSKAAIAKIVLDCEERCAALSPLVHGRTIQPTHFDSRWHQILAEKYFEGAELGQASDQIDEALSRVKFISFNYDRCIEQFLRIALQGLYGLDQDAASKRIQNLVYYPYGSLGALPGNGSAQEVPFGGRKDENYRLFEAVSSSSSIRTFTEGAVEKKEVDRVKASIAAADTIIFLGFGFHDQNLEILSPELKQRTKVVKILGTAKGLSEAARMDVERKIRRYFYSPEQLMAANITHQHEAFLFDATCWDFMAANRHAL